MAYKRGNKLEGNKDEAKYVSGEINHHWSNCGCVVEKGGNHKIMDSFLTTGGRGGLARPTFNIFISATLFKHRSLENEKGKWGNFRRMGKFWSQVPKQNVLHSLTD